MTETSTRTLDFGPLTVEEHLVKNSSGGPRVGRVELVGPFNGTEQGASGPVWTYFLKTLPARYDSVIVVLARTKYINDGGPALLEKLQKKLREQGGNSVLSSPPAKIKIVLSMLGFSFAPDEATALQELDSLSSPEN